MNSIKTWKKLNKEYDEFVALKRPSFELMDDGSCRCVCEYDEKDFRKTYVVLRTGNESDKSDNKMYSVFVYENYEKVDETHTYDQEEAIKFAYLYAHKQWTGEEYYEI